MQFIRTLLLAISLVGVAMASKPLKNSSREFTLKTELVPGQSGKADFSDLYVTAYHTGAGFNSAVFAKSRGDIAFLNGTKGHYNGITYQNLIFDLGNGYPWGAIVEYGSFTYAQWVPVDINIEETGGKDSGYYFNDNGLQWTQAPHMKPSDTYELSWLACDWWYGGPQLFTLLKRGDVAPDLPCSCAEVYLKPEYT